MPWAPLTSGALPEISLNASLDDADTRRRGAVRHVADRAATAKLVVLGEARLSEHFYAALALRTG